MPVVPRPPSSPLDLVLHIGSGKTGTSSIQRFMHCNRTRLASLGQLYPETPGRTRHDRLGLWIKSDEGLRNVPNWHRQKEPDPATFRRAFPRQLFSEIEGSGLSRVILSDEGLYSCSGDALRRLCTLVDRIAGSLRIVLYLRRQDDHLVSRYQQLVKVRETRRLTEWIQELDHSRIYDYYARLRMWERLLEPDEFVVRRFEHDSFVDGSLFQDFFDAAGIEARAGDLEQVELVNESLDAEAVEVLRILNIYRDENEEAAALLGDNRALAAKLAGASTGPTLTAPAPVLDEFMAPWAESNRAVATDYLGDESGQLFRVPRTTSNTTTEQHLDPARLAYFLTVLQLPEQAHTPLRRLVEREAKDRRRDDQLAGGASGSRPSTGVPSTELPAHYDAAAKAVIERVGHRTMTQPAKLFGLILATRHVVRHGIIGGIVECGVWRGGSMQAAALTLLECGAATRDLHLYDTFEGMTPPEEVDRRVDGKSAAELLASSSRESKVWGVATLDDVKTGMAEVGYPPERVHFHPGRVEDTIPREAPESVAILRLDTDWYASTRHELEHLYDRLSPGGVLIIDDYGYWEGSRQATEEFLDRSGARLLLLPAADGRIAVKPGP